MTGPTIQHNKFTLKGGRVLSYLSIGDERAKNLAIYAHGFPGSRMEGLAFTFGNFPEDLRLIAFDRPGVGGSEFFKGHSIKSWGESVREFVDGANFQSLTLIGVSGGAPYTLSAAAAMSGYPLKVALVCSMGPIDAPGVMRKMLRQNRWLLEQGRKREWFVRPIVKTIAKGWEKAPGASLTYLQRILNDSDKEILKRADVHELLRGNIEEAFQGGINGPVQEFFNLANDWGIELASIQHPVTLWHGLGDRYVPPEMSKYLASVLPMSNLRLIPDEGHFFPFKITEEILSGIYLDA